MVRLGLKDRDVTGELRMKESDFRNALSGANSTIKLSGPQLVKLQGRLGVKLTGSSVGQLTAKGRKLVEAARQAKEAEAATLSEEVKDAEVVEEETKDAEVVEGQETAEDTAAAENGEVEKVEM